VYWLVRAPDYFWGPVVDFRSPPEIGRAFYDPIAARAIRDIKLAFAALRGQVPAIRWSARRKWLRERPISPAPRARAFRPSSIRRILPTHGRARLRLFA
jgi:hypothetical protein